MPIICLLYTLCAYYMPIILYAYGLDKHIITYQKHSQMNQDLVHHAAKFFLCVHTSCVFCTQNFSFPKNGAKSCI